VPAWCRISLACLLLAGTPDWSNAQNKDESRIRVVISSAKALRTDLKTVLEMSPPNLKKQAQVVDETLESFQEGVDPDKPIGFDIVFGSTDRIYNLAVPVSKLEGNGGFLNNLRGFQYKITGPTNGLYTLSDPPPAAGRKKVGAGKAAPAPGAAQKKYFMRHAHGYGMISPRQEDVPAVVPNPLPNLAKLIGNRDVAAWIENDDATLDKRRSTFTEYRKQIEAAIKFKRGEPNEEFEVRKMSVRQSFNEAERFLLESKLLEIAWTTDIGQKLGTGDLRLEASPKTSLEESVELLVKDPSYFANVKLHDKPALALKANFAIDPMRSEHAKDIYATVRPAMKLRIDDRATLTADGKAAAKEAFDKLLDMLEAARAIKVLDVFIDLHEASEKHTGVCGIRAVDGDKAIEILELFPRIRDGWKFDANVDERGGVKIHAVTVAPHRTEEFRTIFAGDAIVYIGTSKDAVWGAAGLNALEELKTAIDQSQAALHQAGPVDPEFFKLAMNFGPFIDLLDVVRAHEPKREPPAKDAQNYADLLQDYKDAQEYERQATKLRKLAKDAFAGCNLGLEASLRRDGNAVIGAMTAHECALRFVGSAIANWAAENLE
jgi:hypothetical protein